MENVSFSASGEEIERALMDLGPLLGVTIKEEVSDELAEPNATASLATNNVAASGSGGVVADGGAGSGKSGLSESEGGEGTEGADSLASPSASARAPLSAMRCVLCGAVLALAHGTPKLMECLHSICEPCIKAKIEEKQSSSRDFLGAERVTVTCPECRLQCQPANMIDQRFVLEKVALDQIGNNGGGASGGGGGAGGEAACNSCEDTEPATSYCVDCAEFICDNCVHAHQRLKITKDHTIKSKEEAVAELQAAQGAPRSAHDMFCRDHPQERLALFCETCDRLTCRDCQLQLHRDHKYQFSTEMAQQARSSISSLLSEVSYKRVLLGSAMKVIRDRQQLIADKKKALVHEITQTVVKLTHAINTRGKQLVLRLNEVCDAKQRTLSEKKDALEQLAAITDHCVAFVNTALEQGSDTAVLYSKRCVCAHLQRIKCRRADIPNPEIPVRITLALDNLPDLLKVLSSLGAIVVDGKVDGGGGAGGAQGPYHPPGAPAATAPAVSAPAAPAPAPPHSAVVALQHVAMQQTLARYQSYVQNRSGGVSPVGVGVSGAGYMSALQQQMRARQHAPALLRHPHVTSTTHPHHLHGIQDMNLRGLLNAHGQRTGVGVGGTQQAVARPSPQQQQQQAMHHAYQQMMGAYGNNAYAAVAAACGAGGAGSRRAVSAGGAGAGVGAAGPRTPSPAPPPPPHYAHHMQHQHAQLHQQQQQQQLQQQQQQQQQQAKWHIPQHSLPNGNFDFNMLSSGGSSSSSIPSPDFKITLGRQSSGSGSSGSRPPPTPSIVTSTNPKTPSPSLNGGVSSELDKVCAESVQDLMATIAKLDSNGVQVLRERASPPPALPAPPARLQPAPADLAPLVHSSTDAHGKLGGTGASGVGVSGTSDPNEDWCAVCMDGGELMCCDKCPKVFHQYCHIPTIEKLPDETETWQCLLCVNFADIPEDDEDMAGAGLTPRQQKVVERITLELYCQYELSLPFREPVPPENLHYHSKVCRPMCLDAIRMKLQPASGARYQHAAHFVADCRLLFRNALAYNPPDSQLHKDAKRLEEFFDAQLAKWLPHYMYWSGEGEPPLKRARLD